MARPKKLPDNKAIVIRFSLETLDAVKEAASLMRGYSEADILRLAAEIGLVRLRKLSFKVPEVLDSAADQIEAFLNDLKLAAEDPAQYRVSSPHGDARANFVAGILAAAEALTLEKMKQREAQQQSQGETPQKVKYPARAKARTNPKKRTESSS